MVGSLPGMSSAGFTSFGALLRYLRRRQRLTQQDLAIATGYSTAQISRLEQNQRLPNPGAIRALFVPALGLADDASLAAQLLELAEMARVPDEPDAAPADPQAADGGASPVVAASPALLLVTKLYRPRPRSARVVRPRLLARLDAALEHPLTLVAAPAGFGKTTLLAEWAAASALDSARSNHALAWLTLDARDNDPTTFLRYLIAALQTVAPTVGQTTLALLQSPRQPDSDDLLRLLLNDLAALPLDAVLVLDDYHLVTEGAIHALLGMLLAHLPPALHLIIATRATPPLPLARLRAHAQIVELQASDLRFTLAEAEELLQDAVDRALSASEIGALHSRTEGWIAGLQLAALALAERAQSADFIDAFTGSNRFILDYLVSEVLECQPAHIQGFLLQTAVLERLCGPLCDAVLGVAPANPGASDVLGTPATGAYTQVVLEELERANLFLVPLDDERRWYRYHQLFGEVLRERLHSGAPNTTVVDIHRRAGVWLAAQGLIPEALQHVLATQDWAHAAELITQHGRALALQGQVTTVLGWLSRLPDAEIRSRPLLALTHAQVLTLTSQLAAAEERLRTVERAVPPTATGPDAQLIHGYIAAVRADMVRDSGDFLQGVALARQALAQLPDSETLARARLRSLIVLDCLATGDLTDSTRQLAEDAVAAAQASGSSLTYHHALSDLGWIRLFQGHLQAAAAIFRQAQRVAETAGLRTLATTAYAQLGLGEVLREWNRLEEAEASLACGLSLAAEQSAINPYAYLVGAVVLARVKHARGDHAGAIAALDQFAVRMRGAAISQAHRATVAAIRAQLQLAQGDLGAAAAWAAQSGLDWQDAVGFARENEYLTLARVWIAQGRLDSSGLHLTYAHAVLERLLDDAEHGARVGSSIEALVLQALAYTAERKPVQAQAALGRALELGAPAGFCRMFVDEGPLLHALLAEIRRAPTVYAHAAYLDRLLAAF